MSRPVVFDYIDTRAALLERTERLWQLLGARGWKSLPVERFALDAAADAHARLESRRTVGALILVS